MNKKASIKRIKEDGNSDVFCLKLRKKYQMGYFGRNSDRLLSLIEEKIFKKHEKMWIVTVNPEFVVKSTKSKDFKETIDKADLRVIDGVGLLWAREVLKSYKGLGRWWKGLVTGVEILQGKRREGLITGVDLIKDLCKLAVLKKKKVFFLGGFLGGAKRSGENLAKKFKGLNFDYCPGEPEVNNEEVIRRVNAFGPDFLFVAYGMGKQEEWIERNITKLKVGVVVGVGRSFDYYGGTLKRAPKWVRKMGLEWLYSLKKEPKRWRRQLALLKFLWMVLVESA